MLEQIGRRDEVGDGGWDEDGDGGRYGGGNGASEGVFSLSQALDQLERELIVGALKASGGNRAKAARALGMTERVMGLRIKKHGIDCKAFRTVS